METSAIVQRLNLILPSILPPNQYGFVPHRYSSDTTTHLHFLLDKFRNDPELQGLFLSLDQHKAYDHVNHSSILAVFTALGCGPQFLSLLSTLVLNKKSHEWVIVNSFLTNPVYLNCGAGQGHSLSCPIYILTLQPLVEALTIQYIATSILHTSNVLPSIHIPTTLVFVDNITLILSELATLPHLNTLKNDWKAASGGIFAINKSLQLGLNLPPDDPLFFPDTKHLSPIDI